MPQSPLGWTCVVPSGVALSPGGGVRSREAAVVACALAVYRTASADPSLDGVGSISAGRVARLTGSPAMGDVVERFLDACHDLHECANTYPQTHADAPECAAP